MLYLYLPLSPEFAHSDAPAAIAEDLPTLYGKVLELQPNLRPLLERINHPIVTHGEKLLATIERRFNEAMAAADPDHPIKWGGIAFPLIETCELHHLFIISCAELPAEELTLMRECQQSCRAKCSGGRWFTEQDELNHNRSIH